MSCFIVSRAHIDALVTAAIFGVAENRLLDGFHRPYFKNRPLEAGHVHILGQWLWCENVASYRARYPNDPTEFAEYMYTFPTSKGSLNPPSLRPAIEVIKLIHCYEYQSCEHDGWESSDARKFCTSLLSAVISSLPGYDAAPWGID